MTWIIYLRIAIMAMQHAIQTYNEIRAVCGYMHICTLHNILNALFECGIAILQAFQLLELGFFSTLWVWVMAFGVRFYSMVYIRFSFVGTVQIDKVRLLYLKMAKLSTLQCVCMEKINVRQFPLFCIKNWLIAILNNFFSYYFSKCSKFSSSLVLQ